VEAADAQLRNGAGAVAKTAFAEARPTHENAFKVTLAERTLAALIAENRA
jgi:xanthine dehydrogenase YagS FAD-binding subunit